MSPIKPIRYTIEARTEDGHRWVALCGGLDINEARAAQERWQVVTRITATLSDGRKVVLP